MTVILIPQSAAAFLRKGVSGKDLGKPTKPLLPETMGVISAVVYLLIMILFIPFAFYQHIKAGWEASGRGAGIDDSDHVTVGDTFPHNKLGAYLSAVLSLQGAILLGLADDFFDLRWRHKFFIPAFAAIPLLVVYYVDYGVTYVVVPTPLRPYFGDLVDLGFLYYAYMAALTIFCTNSINILAGVNGVEVGQSVVIACCILANDLLYISGVQEHVGLNHPAYESHLFSACFLMPFLGVSLALLYHNWWPASVFVGDTFCYFAGMTFATVGIQGHFSKTMLLFFIPQVFNFVLSAPQLFHIIPCPRHRLPKFQAKTGLVDASIVEFERPPSTLQRILLIMLERLYLVRLVRHPHTGVILSSSNLTLLSVLLVRLGPMREDTLTICMMTIQALFGIAGFLVRHRLARLVFTDDNRMSSQFYV
ncbi:putative UDP-N-acetylglucosamine--dolichyl-phosphate N-acetylglucosaminephosphotransferase [Protomyces lactucae-debilis]|uniref:UDP-N-acetylglucosamine--dolichyl-phosphate N-acetylglucosaminephosphotransferase n=1 Tax=Protomyces lactucae-debilis TaxID=2754530 RepID=A0A1Y2FJ66_PROLT|nr:putative UDP-N-acetylglucosamine--dolichyl-phosphate N-acetylglucosaminephosphotransferase [Protomyces lactucae-debilis]ORY83647.1 putative UDP-N-acetylglucosamine--dolichyl-phosphate N-acetylglucosaminephosphotransferase [Protomyces lactucae-debilis]